MEQADGPELHYGNKYKTKAELCHTTQGHVIVGGDLTRMNYPPGHLWAPGDALLVVCRLNIINM